MRVVLPDQYRQLQPRPDAQCAAQVLDFFGYRRTVEVDLGPDLVVCVALRDQPGDGALALAQPGQVCSGQARPDG
jgi:hypothetical protein